MCKVTKCSKLQLKCPSYKMSKVTKCQKLHNLQSYKMSKVTIKMSKDTKCQKLQNFQSYKTFCAFSEIQLQQLTFKNL